MRYIREKCADNERRANASFPRGYPGFPRGNAEFSTAVPQPADIRGFIQGQMRPVSELRAVALPVLITLILLCYDETGRKSSEIGNSKKHTRTTPPHSPKPISKPHCPTPLSSPVKAP